VPGTITSSGITHSFASATPFYDAFAYPKSYGALIWTNQDSMTDINLINTNYVRTEIVITGVEYYLYYNNTLSAPTTNTYTFKWQ